LVYALYFNQLKKFPLPDFKGRAAAGWLSGERVVFPIPVKRSAPRRCRHGADARDDGERVGVDAS
jgi:hypothetical protein